mmetsp:Transcript_29265/g.84072  ORF Transcript_29265/g.84072 Transcript_29265/m.84072 type:complete len:612 (-) Transcript_29265:156-1991(-)
MARVCTASTMARPAAGTCPAAAAIKAHASADWGGQPGSRLGLDIGGTLTKLVFFESETRPSWCDGRIARLIKGFAAPGSPRPGWAEREEELSFEDVELGGKFHFVTFRSDHMEMFVALMEEHDLHTGLESILATGGGAYKYARLFKERLGISLRPVDELGVVIQGIAWLIDRPTRDRPLFLDYPVRSHCATPPAPPVPQKSGGGGGFGSALGPLRSLGACRNPSSSMSVASMSTNSGSSPTPASSPCGSPRRSCMERGAQALFPFLLVNIGSGVSVVRVDGLDRFERVSGSAIGGGTFWGLCKLLVPDCGDFESAGRLAEQGDASSVNLLVKDIYGGDYALPNGLKLPGSITASFFAKAAAASAPGPPSPARTSDEEEERNDRSAAGGRAGTDADVLHALTKMVSSNICQIAYLNARLHNTQRIVFTGNFLRQNPVAREAISENMERVSAAHQTRGEDPFRVLFMQHEGYFGALGTFLNNVQDGHLGASAVRTSPPLRRSARELIAAAASAAAGSTASRRGGAATEEDDEEGSRAKCLPGVSLRRAFRSHTRRPSLGEAAAAAGASDGASPAAPAAASRLPSLLAGGAKSLTRMLAVRGQDVSKAAAVEAL